MDLANTIRAYGTSAQSALVDPFLDRDVRFRFELEVALFRVGAVIVLQCALDVDGVGVVAFDEIAVVAVHRSHQICQGRQYTRREAPAKSCGMCRQFDGQIVELPAMARALRDPHWFHQRYGLTPVERGAVARLNGRFIIRIRISHNHQNIRNIRRS